jgi:hypothetical protein
MCAYVCGGFGLEPVLFAAIFISPLCFIMWFAVFFATAPSTTYGKSRRIQTMLIDSVARSAGTVLPFVRYHFMALSLSNEQWIDASFLDRIRYGNPRIFFPSFMYAMCA